MDEVNNFLANFKKKRGRKAAENPKKENETKNENKIEANNNEKLDDIFGGNKTTSSLFDNDNNKNKTENIFDEKNNNKEKKDLDDFEEKQIKEINNKNLQIKEKYDASNSVVLLNNPLLNEQDKKEEIFEEKKTNAFIDSNNIFESNNNDNKIFDNQNDVFESSNHKENNIFDNTNKAFEPKHIFDNQKNIFESNNNEPQNIYYNQSNIFESNNNNETQNIFNNKNNIFESNNIEPQNIFNNQNNIFDSNNNDPKNIFESADNNENKDNIFFQTKKINNDISHFQNKNNVNIKRTQPKPPKLNNKFSSPFMNHNKKIENDHPNNIEKNENSNNELINNKYENYFEDNINNNIPKEINSEIEKLDEEQINPPFTDSSNNLNANIINNFENSLKNKINENANFNINSENINKLNYTHEKINSDLNNKLNLNYEESYNFSGIDKDFILLSDNGGLNILINNIYSILKTYSENNLFEHYFPISYNTTNDLNKISSLLSIILNNGNELNDPISHIAVYLLKYIIENKMDINKIDIINNNELKNKIIEIISNSIKNENKGIISLNNLFNTSILFNCLNNNNNSMKNYNILNDSLNHPLEYIIDLFNGKIMNKNSLLYIYFLLLNMKENENNSKNIGFEEYDIIFENFESTLFILLKYFNNDSQKIKMICNLLLNSYSPKINYCHFIILKCLLNDYEIRNEKYYGKKFVSFLQFPNIEKLLISDIFSYILFSMNSQLIKVVAKSSILIKYKYTLIRQNYKKDQKLVLFGQKIYGNINQFGLISKNNYFKNYLKDLFYNNINILEKEDNKIIQ